MRILIILSILLLAACKTNLHGDVPDPLYLKARTFEDVVRWGDLGKMLFFLKYDEASPPIAPPGLDNVRVTSYDLGAELSEVGEWRWTQTAIIDYVLLDRQVVRQLVDKQFWVSEDQGKSWYRENPLPRFD